MKRNQTDRSSLKKRLTGYAGTAGALMLLAPGAASQIKYSGLQNLELFFPDDALILDMDTNTVDDILFRMYTYSSSTASGPYFYRSNIGLGVVLAPDTDTNKNSWITRMVSMTSETYYGDIEKAYATVPAGLMPGSIIDTLRDGWANTTSLATEGILAAYRSVEANLPYGSYSYYLYIGDFLGQERFLGVRFFIGSDQHYGWVRINTPGTQVEPLTIVDWAYETTPDTRILAGDGLGIDLPPQFLMSGIESHTNDSVQTVRINAGEEITGLDIDDLVVINGNLSDFNELVPGLEYTVDIRAIEEGNVTVAIPDSVATDISGNFNGLAVASWNFDVTPPRPEFYDFAPYTNFNFNSLSFSFSEEITGLEPSDLTIINGSIVELDTVSPGETYFVTIMSDNEGEVSVVINAGAVTDLAGNTNENEAEAVYVFDATSPVVTLSVPGETTAEPETTVDILISESLLGFDAGYFNITNGTATDLTMLGDNLHWSLDVTADAAGIVIVELPAFAVSDLAYNGNEPVSVGWLFDPDATDIQQIKEEIKIYPNPANGQLNIRLESEALVRLINAKGNIVFAKENFVDETINVSGFTPGIYLVDIIQRDYVIRKLVVVE